MASQFLNRISTTASCYRVILLLTILLSTQLFAETPQFTPNEINPGGDPELLEEIRVHLNDFYIRGAISSPPKFDYIRININNIGELDYLIYPRNSGFCGAKGNCALLAALDSEQGDFRIVTELTATGMPEIANRFPRAFYQDLSGIQPAENPENPHFNNLMVTDEYGFNYIWRYDATKMRYVAVK